MFIYHIQYQDQASLHLMTSKYQSIYHFLHFFWSAYINEAYSKVLNIDACAQKLKRLQERFSCIDFEICLWIFCDFFQLSVYDFIIFEKWVINLILKIVKSHFDDYFWLFVFVMLELLIDHMNHMWSMKFCHHIQACFCYKVSSHYFWSCNTTFLSNKRKIKKNT